MKLFNNIKTSYAHIPYTWKHKIVLIRLEKQFTGKVSLRILLHDANKLISYIFFPFLTLDQHRSIHTKVSKHHHYNDIANLSDSLKREIVLDWESARYTKPDKPWTAKEWCIYRHTDCYPYLIQIFNEWNL